MTQPRIRTTALVTLTLLFGLHFFRAFLPAVIAYLGQFVGAVQEGLFALAVFALALFAPLVHRVLGERGALALTIGGVALARLALQFADTPPAQLALAALGLILFGWFLPLWQQSPRNRPLTENPPALSNKPRRAAHHALCPEALPALVIAFPLAFLADISTRTLLFTYDFAWRRDLLSMLLVAALSATLLALLWRELQTRVDAPLEEPTFLTALPFAGVGAFLYLALVVIHNPAVLAAATGWGNIETHLAANFILALGTLAYAGAVTRRAEERALDALIPGALLVMMLSAHWLQINPGWLWLGIAAPTAWACLGWILTGTARVEPRRRGVWRTALATLLALVTLLICIFLVAQYDWRAINLIASAMLAAAAIGASQTKPVKTENPLRLILSAAALALVLIGIWVVAIPAPPPRAQGEARGLRVMTYNIHQGISADMQVSLDAIANVIAAQKPDVVVLNEVNRARPNYGLIDTLPFIAHHLQMPYRFGANYPDGQYGNAILSRDPILEWNNTPLDAKTTETRGVLRAVIRTSLGDVTFYATHLDHISGAKNVRAPQVAQLLKLWNGTPRAIIAGDLNAEPDKPELQAIFQAGFVDALRVGGKDDAFTFWDPIPTPGRRIDYIFVTPDLTVVSVNVIATRASDHLPVVAEIK